MIDRNPLLGSAPLPRFDLIHAAHVAPAVNMVLDTNRETIRSLTEGPGELEGRDLLEALEDAQDLLDRTWARVRHLNSVSDSDALRQAYRAALAKISAYRTELGQNQALYRALQGLADSPACAELDGAQRRVLDLVLVEFRMSGVHLPEREQRRVQALEEELAQLQARFEENLLDATRAWTYPIADHRQLSGLPQSALDTLRSNARERDMEGWLLTLDLPSYLAVVTYADDRTLRERLYLAYGTRASDQAPGPARWDNTPVLERILAIRAELARMLGYPSFADLSLEQKMAKDSGQVVAFLEELATKTRSQAELEFDELQAYARDSLDIERLQPWDLHYVSEKLRQARYSISAEALRPYFPIDQVLDGLFRLVGRLYGLRIRSRDDVPVWHPDVRFFEILDEPGTLRGQFYLDLYARKGKRAGAWMDECVSRRRCHDGIRAPVAFLSCNASPAVDHKPALLTHDEVITLFHEFGHGLHHMLTLVEHTGVAGIRGVEWDAVELPSQFMENWCWEREALDLFARHHETGKALPEPLYTRLVSARQFNAALDMVRQIELALFDFRIHLEHTAASAPRVQEILDRVRLQVSMLIPPPCVRSQNSFTHIFSGGYAAGYYSYKWAEVLSADAFSAFEEEGLFNPLTACRFMHCILERGGSKPALALFSEFRGREPRSDALLRRCGLTS